MGQASRARWRWSGGSLAVAAAGLAAALLLQPAPAVAQDEDTARPAVLVAGDCNAPGGTVEDLTDATLPVGTPEGSGTATMAASSFTRIPQTIDELLASPHAIIVSWSKEIDIPLACGTIGGVPTDIGALVIGLREVDNSDHSGIAFIAPDLERGGSSVSLFFAPSRIIVATEVPTPPAIPGATVVIGSDGAPLVVIQPTPPPTVTLVPTVTETPTITPSPTVTETPTVTPTSTSTMTPTVTSTPTATPTVTPTPTATVTNTPAPDYGALEATVSGDGIEMPVWIGAGPVSITVTNEGDEIHGFQITGENGEAFGFAEDLAPKQTRTLVINLPRGTYTVTDPRTGATLAITAVVEVDTPTPLPAEPADATPEEVPVEDAAA